MKREIPFVLILILLFFISSLLFYLHLKPGSSLRNYSVTFYTSSNLALPSVEPTIFPDNESYPTSPSGVVFNYYLWAFSCLNNHFWNANENPSYPNQTVSTHCNHFKNRYLSRIKNTESFICGYEPPLGFSVNNETVNGDTAYTTLSLSYLDGNKPIQIELKREDNFWKILQEFCPVK